MTPELLQLIAPAVSDNSSALIQTSRFHPVLIEHLEKERYTLDQSIILGVKGKVIVVPQLPQLVPSKPSKGKNSHWKKLNSLKNDELVPNITNEIEMTAIRAGLLLMYDYLEESHQLAQSIEGESADGNGDYWHAIMHRREGDFSNAKYWFRRVGEHPIFTQLLKDASEIVRISNKLLGLDDKYSQKSIDIKTELEDIYQLTNHFKWDPFAFVDICQKLANRPESIAATVARSIQSAEMMWLMQYCYEEAVE